VADGSTVQHLRTVSACLEALVEYLELRRCGALCERIAAELRQVVEHIEEGVS
jgi:hypothetical protein